MRKLIQEIRAHTEERDNALSQPDFRDVCVRVCVCWFAGEGVGRGTLMEQRSGAEKEDCHGERERRKWGSERRGTSGRCVGLCKCM